jgi:hypothetical protein
MSKPTVPSIEQLRGDLFMLSDHAKEMPEGMEEFDPTFTLSKALDELTVLRAKVSEMVQVQMLWQSRRDEACRQLMEVKDWRGQAEPLLRRLAAGSVTWSSVSRLWRCNDCEETHRYKAELRHDEHCASIMARTLLGKGGQ